MIHTKLYRARTASLWTPCPLQYEQPTSLSPGPRLVNSSNDHTASRLRWVGTGSQHDNERIAIYGGYYLNQDYHKNKEPFLSQPLQRK